MNGREARSAWNRTAALKVVVEDMEATHDRLAANLAKKSGTDTAAALRDIAEYERLKGVAEELINGPWVGGGEGGTGGSYPEESQSQ